MHTHMHAHSHATPSALCFSLSDAKLPPRLQMSPSSPSLCNLRAYPTHPLYSQVCSSLSPTPRASAAPESTGTLAILVPAAHVGRLLTKDSVFRPGPPTPLQCPTARFVAPATPCHGLHVPGVVASTDLCSCVSSSLSRC